MANHGESKTNATKVIIAIIIIAVIAVGGYLIYSNVFNTTETSESTATENTNSNNNMTAEDIANKLKEKNANVGNIFVYTAETDLNNLLGRPNQYTSKVTFEDTRLEQTNYDNEFLTEEERQEPIGGTIEVFENEEDMKNRKEYVETISSQASMFAEYAYSAGNALLRLDNQLTPDQAKEYEEAFYEIMK